MPELMGLTSIPHHWKEYIFHRGCSWSVQSILGSGLISGGKASDSTGSSLLHTSESFWIARVDKSSETKSEMVVAESSNGSEGLIPESRAVTHVTAVSERGQEATGKVTSRAPVPPIESGCRTQLVVGWGCIPDLSAAWSEFGCSRNWLSQHETGTPGKTFLTANTTLFYPHMQSTTQDTNEALSDFNMFGFNSALDM